MAEWAVFRSVEKAVQEIIAQEGKEYRTELDITTSIIRTAYSEAGLTDGSSQCLPYLNAAFRWAYTFRFVTAHVYLVLKSLNKLWESQKGVLNLWHQALPGLEMTVCCVGGGPGSDLIGLALFLQEQNLHGKGIRGYILDCWPQWQDTYVALARHFDPIRMVLPRPEMVNYCPFDFNAPESWGMQLERIGEADLITMVKFVSAVSSNPSLCQAHLTVLMCHMKKGAFLFIVDNAVNNVFELVNQAAAHAGLHQLSQVHYKKGLQIPQTEKDAMDSSALRLAGLKPQKSSAVSAILWQKRISRTASLKTLKNSISKSNPMLQLPKVSKFQPNLPEVTRSTLSEKEKRKPTAECATGPNANSSSQNVSVSPCVPAPKDNSNYGNISSRTGGKPDLLITSGCVTNKSKRTRKNKTKTVAANSSPQPSTSSVNASSKKTNPQPASKAGSVPKKSHSNLTISPNSVQCTKKNNKPPSLSNPGLVFESGSVHQPKLDSKALNKAQTTNSPTQTNPPLSENSKQERNSDASTQTISLEEFLRQVHELWAAGQEELAASSKQSPVVSMKSQSSQDIPSVQNTPETIVSAFHSPWSTTTGVGMAGSSSRERYLGQVDALPVHSNSREELTEVDERTTTSSSNILFWVGISLLGIFIYRRYYNS